MKVSDQNVKEKAKSIAIKAFPGKLPKGPLMPNKLAHAKALSATIKGFKKIK